MSTAASLDLPLELISFKVCPFVQRSAILLNEKGVDYTLTHINPQDTPDWFKEISPMGKVPVLKVGDTPVFESAVIAEYLDEVYAPALHPADPLQKAHHRAWMEFCSELIMRQFKMNTAKDEEAFNAARESLQQGLQLVAAQLADDTPYFSGADFHVVDAVYAPLFMRLNLAKQFFGLDLEMGERLQAWSDALLAKTSVKTSVVEDFDQVFKGFLTMQGGYILSLSA